MTVESRGHRQDGLCQNARFLTGKISIYFSRRSHRPGFTLIELLVVIAILAAILFPVFAQARQTACLSNLQQVSLADQIYVQDYKETFTNTEWGGDMDEAHEYYWGDMLYPYIKNWQMLQCPSAS